MREGRSDLLADMDLNDWVKRIDLASPITERAVVVVGRHGSLPTTAWGSGVFIGDRLIMTARHVVQDYWDFYNNPNVKMDQPGKKMADFEMFFVQAPGNSAKPALWAARKISPCPYSDLALVSVVPVDELAKAQLPLRSLRLNILPPVKGEKIAGVGYPSTSVVAKTPDQVEFKLNPSISEGTVTKVFPEKRDSSELSFPTYEIEAHFVGGMSGGPIFNEAGELCGLISSGYDEAPIEYGAVLWPMVGIRIDHPIPEADMEPPYTIIELARSGVMDVRGWEYVHANAEPYVDSDGTRKIRLRNPQ